MYKIAVDAMSGDLGSQPVVEACKKFVREHSDVELYVTGKLDELKGLEGINNIHLVEANDVVLMTDGIMSVRRKKDSSMVKAINLAADNTVDGVISCGSTGGYYTAAMLFLKKKLLPGVEKACLMAVVPTADGNGACLLDTGANAECTVNQLVSFAKMGNVYAREVKGIKEPRISLLNIGTEEKKGDEVHQETFKALKELDLNFVGNIEGRDILTGCTDVIVADGFSGNIALKSLEGCALVLMKLIKESMMSTTKGKIGALLAKDSLYSIKDRFDYKSVGGAQLMGFETVVIKAHGASDGVAFNSAMELVLNCIKKDVVSKMKEGMK